MKLQTAKCEAYTGWDKRLLSRAGPPSRHVHMAGRRSHCSLVPPCQQHCNGVPGSAKRAGFSLIEVIIATAILMGSAVVLSRLAGMGREQSQKARLHADAQELCQQTMNELLLQMRPPELVELMPLIPLPRPIEETPNELDESGIFSEAQVPQESIRDETNPEWRYSVRMEPLPSLPGMWSLTVVVVQGDETLERPIQFSLTRWISGPPPAGAFDEMSKGIKELTTTVPGGVH